MEYQIGIYCADNYNSAEEAEESGALYYTRNLMPNLDDVRDIVEAVSLAHGGNDEYTFQAVYLTGGGEWAEV